MFLSDDFLFEVAVCFVLLYFGVEFPVQVKRDGALPVHFWEQAASPVCHSYPSTDLLLAVGIFQPVWWLQEFDPEIHRSLWPCVAGKKVLTYFN